MRKVIPVSNIILIVILWFSFVKSGYALTPNVEIEALLIKLIDDCARHPTGGIDFQEYFTTDFIRLGGELPWTDFHIIDQYFVEEIKMYEDSAEATVKLRRSAVLNLHSFVVTNDTIQLRFLLKKTEQSGWKIDKQLNENEIWFLENDEIAYLPYLLDKLCPDIVPLTDNVNRPVLEKLYTPLIRFYHQEFEYSKEYLNRLSLEELRLRRNEIFAHYGRTFKDPMLQEYFNSKPWYKPNPNYSDELLTENDRLNVKRILEIEKAKKRIKEAIRKE